MEDEYHSHKVPVQTWRRIQIKESPDLEKIITEIDGRQVLHTYQGENDWPHGYWWDKQNGLHWRYIDEDVCLTEEAFIDAIRERPVGGDYWNLLLDNPPMNKSGDIPYPHSWLEMHIQLDSSDEEAYNKAKAQVLENFDQIKDNIPCTDEFAVRVRKCRCKSCANTAKVNLDAREQAIRDLARSLVEYDEEMLEKVFAKYANKASGNRDFFITWLKAIGESG